MEIPGSQLVLARYLGRWQQFAATPQFYEPAGSYNVAAQYAQRADGSISVVNTLRYGDKSKVIEGDLLPTSNSDRFRVRLKNALLWFDITAPYVVEYAYADSKGEYLAAIVSGGSSTYVLMRANAMTCELQQQIFARLGSERVRRLRFTPQIC
jgi:apolipoprotein D and lipocalin family protein